MQSRRKLMQKTLAFIAVFVLLVMMLPTAAFAAGNGNGKSHKLPEQASENARKVHAEKAEKVKGEDDLEDPEDLDLEEAEDPEEMSEWAMYVHERKVWAIEHEMSPGHANLLDKLLAMSQELPGKNETVVADRILLLEGKYIELFPDDTPFSVKTVIQEIKKARIAAREAAMTPESIA